MTQSTIYVRTDQGDALLGVPYGDISGDARRLLELIDGSASVDDLAEKVPPSVRVNLDEIFTHLLSENLIAESAGAAYPSAQQHPRSETGEPYDRTVKLRTSEAVLPSDAATENIRRMELERELAEVKSQLAATRARQKEVEAVCRRLEQQVATYEKGNLTGQAGREEHQPAQLGQGGNGLGASLANLHQLNRALQDQQLVLDNTLKLRSFQMQLKAADHGPGGDSAGDKEAQSNPQYKKLRVLEFFKGFANAELLHFLTISRWETVRTGTTILNEGDMGMPFFIIVSGSVSVIKQNQLLASLGWGEFFGEFAYLSEHEPLRSAQVVATSDCELLVVDPMDVEFSTVQMRLHVVEALLRGQVKRALLSSKRIDNLLNDLDLSSGHEPN